MNSITLNADLAAVSRLVVEGAMLVYTFAFLSFAFHLSQLASTKKSVRAGASRLEKVGIALLIFAAAIHGVGMTLRGISASRSLWLPLAWPSRKRCLRSLRRVDALSLPKGARTSASFSSNARARPAGNVLN